MKGLKSVRPLKRAKSTTLPIHEICKRQIFGPSRFIKWTWKGLGDDETELLDPDPPGHDPRTLSMNDVRERMGVAGAMQLPGLPELEIPDKMWFTTNHLFVQQTNLDDVWRLGFSPLKFTYTRHVEWLEFE